MKGKIIIIILFLSLGEAGCALFTPPPWVDSETVIKKDATGEVIESRYYRKIKGFSHDPETAGSWASADVIARSRQWKQADSPCVGSIINQSNYTYSLKIRNKSDGVIVQSLLVGPKRKIKSYLPYGRYKAVWSDGRRKSKPIIFSVRPNKVVYVNNEKVGWYIIAFP